MIRLLPILALALLPVPAGAGAWLRDAGEVFLSLGQELTASGSSKTTYYSEYGVTPRLTFGLAGVTGGPSSEHFAFLSLPLKAEGRHRVAAELGIGRMTDWRGITRTVLRPGLAWGMGLDGDVAGWAAADGKAALDRNSRLQSAKLDLTLGLKPTDRDSLVLQLRGFTDGTASRLTLAPSWVRRLRSGLKAQIGGLWQPGVDGRIGLLAATWLTF